MITRSRFIVQPDWAGEPKESEIGGWPVIEGFGPSENDYKAGLSDLTHRPKAIFYGPALKKYGDITPGKTVWTGQGFLSLIKPGEAVFFDLLGPMKLSLPKEATDMTDAWVLFSLWGHRAIEVLERVFSVDVGKPMETQPFHLVTRWHALVVQILNLKGPEPGFLLATDRSHGQNLFDGLIHGGRHLGLKPISLTLWQHWFGKMNLI
jgi:glycine cleavage system aminomethyltransferase T